MAPGGHPGAAWPALDAPWRVCLELAWRACGAGTIPVGVALGDALPGLWDALG